jgi:hypothetical protein
MHPDMFRTKSLGWELGLASGKPVWDVDPEEVAERVLRDFEELTLTRTVAADEELRMPSGRVPHPYRRATICLHVNLMTDSFGKRRCKYPTNIPLVRFIVPIPVHLHVSQALNDKGSLCIDKAFAQRIEAHGLGKWNPSTHNLVHVAKMCWEVLAGSHVAADSISGVELAPDKVPVLLRLMESTSEHMRPQWRRRKTLVAWWKAVKLHH